LIEESEEPKRIADTSDLAAPSVTPQAVSLAPKVSSLGLGAAANTASLVPAKVTGNATSPAQVAIGIAAGHPRPDIMLAMSAGAVGALLLSLY